MTSINDLIQTLPSKNKEHQMRVAFIRTLTDWHGQEPDALIIREFAVGHGLGYADIAVINDTIHGYELKTASDNLGRLPIQIAYYNRVFGHCTLVCDRRHMEKARAMIPEWWGLVSADERAGVFTFTEICIALANPIRVIEDETHLLWHDECVTLLDRFDKGHKLKWKARRVLYARLLETVPVTLLRAEITCVLRARTQWKPYTVGERTRRENIEAIGQGSPHANR